ncbi:MAG TPA: cysteine desulfurase family protein [Anaerolineae bacterium]|nr:cysteine desulfurase family protein [Anaerolineae bacterium]
MSAEKPIYVDYNATTPIDPDVIEEMIPYLRNNFGNPSSTHWYGVQAKEAVNKARERIANCIGCSPREVIFTSGGSESNNFAIKGICYGNRHHGKHIITSTIEHPSVLQPCKYLEGQGFEVTYIPVDEYGMVSVDDVRNAVRKDTILITIMHANNEVGTIEPIGEIGVFAKEMGIYFHSDAAQSIGKVAIAVDDLGVDLLTIVGHKFYAPKGIGALYVREGTEIDPLIHGAAHEFGLRAGTEAVSQIVALGKACEMAIESLDSIGTRLHRLRERLYELLMSSITHMELNGHPTSRLPNTLNIGLPGVLAGDLLAAIPEIAASPGSACHAESCEISPVLKAMGVEPNYALGSIRLSLGKWNTESEIDDIADLLAARYELLLDGHRH